MDLEKLLDEMKNNEEKAADLALDGMVLGLRNHCIIPGDMSDNDLKALFRQFLTDEYLDQFEDENDLITDLLPKIFTILNENGIKIRFNA